MSRQVRHRVTSVLLGGFLLGAAIVTTGTANAEQIAGAGRQVVFGGGGMLGLSCESTPSIESMTVPAESTVRVVNRTGSRAKLVLNGSSRGTVPENGATEVLFRRGTTAVTLDPNCSVTDQATPVLVTASPSASAPLPDPVPTDDDAGEVPATPSDSGAPPASAAPDAPAAVPPRPTTQGRPTTPRGVTRGTSMGHLPSLPQGGVAHPPIKTKTSTGTPAAGAPVPVAPPGVTEVPSGVTSHEAPQGTHEPALDGVPVTEVPLTTEAVPAADAGPVREVAAAEPVAAVKPMPETRPIGLLAVVAGVFALGVGAAAIRAFVSQRAYRAKVS